MNNKRIISRILTLDNRTKHKWYIVQVWRNCDCPDCDKEHWFDWPWRYYHTIEEASNSHPDAEKIIC